jgi:hypothetical protein
MNKITRRWNSNKHGNGGANHDSISLWMPPKSPHHLEDCVESAVCADDMAVQFPDHQVNASGTNQFF